MFHPNFHAVNVFEQIARQKNAAAPGMAGNPAPKLDIKALPWDEQATAGFKPAEKMMTQEIGRAHV